MAKPSAVGRVYLALLATFTLMLLAWHFTIQEEAHQKATQEVRLWLNNMGAEASKIHFRMLRGTLSLSNIKADVLGNVLLIESLMIKGNLASLTTNRPLVHQVVLRQASWQGQDLLKLWQNNQFELAPSLQTIFRHAKSIRISQSHIQQTNMDEAVYIHQLQVSGGIERRTLRGQGYIAQQQQTWLLDSQFPADFTQQTGQLHYTLHDTLHQVDWSGAWSAKNMQLHIVQTDLKPIPLYPEQTASLEIDLAQQEQAWLGEAQAHLWWIETPEFRSRISGQGQLQGDFDHWIWRSAQLVAVDTMLKQHQSVIKRIDFKNLYVDTKLKQFKAAQSTFKDVALTFNMQDTLSRNTAWAIDLDKVDIQGLNAQLRLKEGKIHMVDLAGTARIFPTSILLDLRSQQGDTSWRIYNRSASKGLYHVQAKHVPLLQVRALLPAPIAHKATTLQGDVRLSLQLQPLQDWKIEGKAKVSNLLVAWDSQQFSAQDVTLRIQQANRLGVQASSLYINKWNLLLPLTPRQAWTEDSNLDDWLGLSWGMQQADLLHGKVALGQPDQVWLDQVQLRLLSWQPLESTTTASLHAEAMFGLSPFKLDMQLQPENGQMLWKSFQLRSKDANLFALSDWLTLSEFSAVEKGHGSMLLRAKQDKSGITGKLWATFEHVTFEDGKAEQDYLSAQLAYPIQRYVEQAKHQKVRLNTTFQGEKNWSLLAGQALLEQLRQQRPSSSTLRRKTAKRTHLSSISLHEKRKFSHNERKRLRDIAAQFKSMGNVRLELVPDLGTAELSPALQRQIEQTQQQMVTFLAQQGIQQRLMYPVRAHNKHRSTGSAGAVHLYAVQ